MPQLPKFSLDVSKTLVFALVFISVTVLVALGKVPADWLEKCLLILIPSPLRDESSEKDDK